jgi:hypothetical protein
LRREEELQENDSDLQHLRISLKAIEIQLPPHPDADLQRGIAAFKHDYHALKRKRVNRSSIASLASFESMSITESPGHMARIAGGGGGGRGSLGFATP